MSRAPALLLLLLTGCEGLGAPCTLAIRPQVQINLINEQTRRPISEAGVRFGNQPLFDSGNGRYFGRFLDTADLTVTATHAAYFPAEGRAEHVTDECGEHWEATLELTRKSPCPVLVPGLDLDLADAADGSLIAGARITARDGTYVETLQEVEPGRYQGAIDRAGVYLLHVEAPGFAPFDHPSVWVQEDDCTVKTTRLSLPM